MRIDGMMILGMFGGGDSVSDTAARKSEIPEVVSDYPQPVNNILRDVRNHGYMVLDIQ